MQYENFEKLVELKFRLCRNLHEATPSETAAIRKTLSVLDRVYNRIDEDVRDAHLEEYVRRRNVVG